MLDLKPSSSSSSSSFQYSSDSSSSLLISDSTSLDSLSDESAESGEGYINNWGGGNLIVDVGETESHPYINFDIDSVVLRPNSTLLNEVDIQRAQNDHSISYLCNSFYSALGSKICFKKTSFPLSEFDYPRNLQQFPVVPDPGGHDDSGMTFKSNFPVSKFEYPENIKKFPIGDNTYSGGNYYSGITIKSQDLNFQGSIEINEIKSGFEINTEFTDHRFQELDNFGKAIAIDGDWLVVGRPTTFQATLYRCASLYKRNGSSWSFVDFLNNYRSPDLDDTMLNVYGFGSILDMEGDFIVVGHPTSHRVVIYQRSGDTWGAIKEIRYDTPQYGMDIRSFGSSISISGNKFISGATDIMIGDVALIYSYDGDDWIFEKLIEYPNPERGGNFGNSVSMSGNKVIIGAYDEANSPTGLYEDTLVKVGGAYIFSYDGTDWILEEELSSPNMETLSCFGNSISMSGNKVIVGAYRETCSGLDNAGRAYIYSYDGIGSWNLEETLESPNPKEKGRYGYSVDINGNDIIVGTEYEDNVYVYNYDTENGWILRDTITTNYTRYGINYPYAENYRWNGGFGDKVIIDGNNCFISAPEELTSKWYYFNNNVYYTRGRVYHYTSSTSPLGICLYGDSVTLGEEFDIKFINSYPIPDIVHLKVFANEINDPSDRLNNLDPNIKVTIKKDYLLANPWTWGNGTNIGDYDKDQSWNNWTYEGTNDPVATYGDSNTGRLKVKFGQSVVSNVIDMTGASAQSVELSLQQTITSGSYQIFIRGWTIAQSYQYNFGEPFDRTHDTSEGLSWLLYGSPFASNFRYMQVKILVPNPER